jgi:hypothetical protein
MNVSPLVVNRKVAKARGALHFSAVKDGKMNFSGSPWATEHAGMPLPVAGGVQFETFQYNDSVVNYSSISMVRNFPTANNC